MRVGMIALSALMSALWIFGLLDQLHSAHATMRYLALSLAIVAVAVWLWQPKPALQERFRNRRNAPD
jgi:hypothetical protein